MSTESCDQDLALKVTQGSQQTKEPFVEIDDGNEDQGEQNTCAYIFKKKISPYVMSFGFRLFGVVLIFVDILLMIVSLVIDGRNKIIEGISLAIALFFFVDVLLRVYLEGFQNYFRSKLNILDSVIVVGTLLINIAYLVGDFSRVGQIPRMVVFFRSLRIIILIRIFRLASEKKHLERASRRMVSENKRRYLKDGFDLDLTYITPRVIAMSFPSSGQQSFYRNPILEVVRFLDTKHEDHYKVYNLCSEQGYDPLYFHYRVERLFIDDHNVPTLGEMLKFTASVREWMNQDPKNIIAIHCKGGKGRTGTMVCIWLIDSNQFESAQESLEYFGERRTDKSTSSKFQGVETPSQSRYVGYYEILKNKYDLKLPPERHLRIKSIKIMAIHGVGKGNGSDLRVQIVMGKKVVFQCVCATQENCKWFFDGEHDCAVISLEGCPVICSDVKVRFESTSQTYGLSLEKDKFWIYDAMSRMNPRTNDTQFANNYSLQGSEDLPKGYDDCAFFFWFNSSFIENNRLYLSRNELDNPHKPKMWKIFRENFALELNFTEP